MKLRNTFSVKICFSLILILLTVSTLLVTKRGNLTRSVAKPISLSSQNLTKPNKEAQARIVENYGKLPLSFEINRGQIDPSVNFISSGNGYTLFLTPTSAVMLLGKPKLTKDKESSSIEQKNIKPLKNNNLKDESQLLSAVLRMELVGANPNSKVSGIDELPGKSNYFVGNDPSQWRTNVTQYTKVKYKEVYKGVDLVYYGNQRDLEYDFIVKPGADPNKIKLNFPNTSLKVDNQGDLLIGLNGEEIRKHKPVVYQEINGTRQIVEANYVIEENNQISFNLDNYDSNKPLVIDPVLSYSTYLGGTSSDVGNDIAVDNEGNVYLTGSTRSLNFPTKNPIPFPTNNTTSHAFVTKINATGDALVYSTYLSGSWAEGGFGIAADNEGNAYVVGSTNSLNFPTKNPIQSSFGGSFDGFVTKINATGNALIYSTYLGSSGDDEGRAIAVDNEGNAYVMGVTNSLNFPTKNPVQPSLGGSFDGFVTKINATGNTLTYSTYLGGSGDDFGNKIAVDSQGNTYITGLTGSLNFPTKTPIQSSFGGGPFDGFVTKINATGNALIYSTYLGGSEDDRGRATAVDNEGNAYVMGVTTSLNFPTKTPIQSSFGGGALKDDGDAFVTKINATGNALVYSTYLGGSGDDEGFGIAVDNEGNAYVVGSTNSRNFPAENPIQFSFAGVKDAFVTEINIAGNALVYSTYLGGNNFDEGVGIAVDSLGNAYVVGSTNSMDFRTKTPIQSFVSGSGFDAFITKITGKESIDAADFTLSITPITQTVTSGASASFSVNAQVINGFDQPINLKAMISSQNTDITTSLSSNTLIIGNSVKLTVNTTTATLPKTVTITIVGQSGSIIRNQNIALVIIPPSMPVADFQLNVAPQTQTLKTGTSTNFTINTQAINGFSQQVGLMATLNPPNPNITLSQLNPIMGNGNATLNVTVANNAPTGIFNILVTGTAGNLVKNTGMSLAIESNNVSSGSGDYSLSITPAVQSIAAGQSTSFTINTQATGGFGQPINFSAVSDQSNNLTIRFSSSAVMPGQSTTMTVSTLANVPPIFANISIVATANQIVRTTKATVNVLSSNDFFVQATPQSQSIPIGQNATFNLKIGKIGNFDTDVVLNPIVSPLSNDVTVQLAPNQVKPGGEAVLQISTASNTNLSNVTVTIVAVAGTITRRAAVTLDILSPDFSIAFPQSQLTVSKGGKGQFVINISRTLGFSQMVSVTPDQGQLNNLKIKLKTFAPQTTTSSQVTFDFKVKPSAPSGTQQITFTGRDELGRTRQNTLTLFIQ